MNDHNKTVFNKEDAANAIYQQSHDNPQAAVNLAETLLHQGVPFHDLFYDWSLAQDSTLAVWVRVLDGSCTFHLDPQDMINDCCGGWLGARIETGDLTGNTDALIQRGLLAIERRTPGLGHDLATEMLDVLVEQVTADNDIFNIEDKAKLIHTLAGCGANLNEKKILRQGRKAIQCNNLVDYIIRSNKSTKKHLPLIEILIQVGVDWLPTYQRPNRMRDVYQSLLEELPVVRKTLLEMQVGKEISTRHSPTKTPKI